MLNRERDELVEFLGRSLFSISSWALVNGIYASRCWSDSSATDWSRDKLSSVIRREELESHLLQLSTTATQMSPRLRDSEAASLFARSLARLFLAHTSPQQQQQPRFNTLNVGTFPRERETGLADGGESLLFGHQPAREYEEGWFWGRSVCSSSSCRSDGRTTTTTAAAAAFSFPHLYIPKRLHNYAEKGNAELGRGRPQRSPTRYNDEWHLLNFYILFVSSIDLRHPPRKKKQTKNAFLAAGFIAIF